jgi:hypothetical protein
MFPDATGQGGGNNFVKLEVILDPAIGDWWAYQVVGEIQRTDGTPVLNNVRTGRAIDYGDRISIVFSFDFLPDGEYRLNTWLDVNGEPGPQAEDPFASLLTPAGYTSFYMPYDDPLTGETEEQHEVWFTVSLFGGGGGGAFFVGPVMRDYNTSYPILYITSLGEAEDYFESFDWSIEDPYGNVMEEGTQYGNNWFQPEFYSYTADWETYYAVIRNVVAVINGESRNLGTARGKITIINDLPTIANFYPEIDSYGFDSPPHSLGYGTFDVHVEVWDANRTVVRSSFDGQLSGGQFYLAGNDLIAYSDFSSGLDRALVYIDVDGDGTFTGDDDLAAHTELAVPYWWGNGNIMWFDIPSDRYIKYEDFQRIYMSGSYGYP